MKENRVRRSLKPGLRSLDRTLRHCTMDTQITLLDVDTETSEEGHSNNTFSFIKIIIIIINIRFPG